MLTSHVASHNGVPSLFVNDALILPGMAIGADTFATTDGFAEAGIPIYQVLHRGGEGELAMGWDGEAHFDYRADEQRMADAIKNNPDGLFLPVVGYLNKVPKAWTDKNISEMAYLNTDRYGLGPSPASEPFTRISEDVIGRYIRHFEQSPFADHIVGYHMINGHSYEWLSWDWFKPDVIGFDDYSQPMRKAFRVWLAQQYDHDVEALREAWKDSRVSFDTAEIPTVKQRMGTPGQVLPARDQGLRVCDFHTCYAESWANQTLRFCQAAKKAVSDTKIVAVFNGYSKLNCHEAYIQGVGHLAFNKLLTSSCVDMIMGPYSYENRGIDGCHFPQVCESSVGLHGKLFMEQIDTRTAVVTPPQPQWSQPDTVAQSVEMMKRDMGTILTHGLAFQYFDMQNACSAYGVMDGGPHWYDHPDLRNMQIALTRLAHEALHENCCSTAEIAVIIDNDSYLLQQLNRGFGTLYVTAQIQYEFDKLSAPIDTYLLEDLPRLRGYKLYIFLNALQLSAPVSAAVRERISEQGATAIWFYAPGCIDHRRFDLAGTGARIGMTLGMDDQRDFIHTDLAPGDHPFLRDTEAEMSYGSDIDPILYAQTTAFFPTNRELFKFSPIFFADDPDADTLGTIRANGRPGLCVKKWNHGTVVYSAAPLLPAQALRNIAAVAGVHQYTDKNDLVYANGKYVFVTSRSDGPKEIRLPRIAGVTDALSKEVISSGTDAFTVFMQKNETRVFTLR